VEQTAAATVYLSRSTPVANRDLAVTLGTAPGATSTGAFVTLAVDGPQARVVVVDPSAPDRPVFATSSTWRQEYAIGSVGAQTMTLHRHVILELVDAPAAPVAVRLTVTASQSGMNGATFVPLPLTAPSAWTVGRAPAVVAATRSGTVTIDPTHSAVSGAIAITVTPGAVTDPAKLVVDWRLVTNWSGVARADPVFGVAPAGIVPRGSYVHAGMDNLIGPPAPIACPRAGPCTLRYAVAARGEGTGVISWQLDVRLVDYASTAPPSDRAVSIVVDGLVSAAGPLPSLSVR